MERDGGWLMTEIGVTLAAIVLLAVAFVAIVVLAHGHATGAGLDLSDHTAIVTALEGQVTLLKAVGGSIITCLAGTIALLFRLVQKQHSTIVSEVKHAGAVKASIIEETVKTREVMERLAGAIDRLEKKIEQCPVAAEWREFQRDREQGRI